MSSNSFLKPTSRRAMLRDSATLAGSALLAQLFPASLRASFSGNAPWNAPWNAPQQGAPPADPATAFRAQMGAIPIQSQKLADNLTMLSGPGGNVTVLTGPDGKLTQFAHASSIQILTPEGKLAQYYMGVEYSPKDIRLGLVEASGNHIGSPVDNILTYCYHYDPQSNKHSLIIARVVQLGGAVTLVMLGGFMWIMFRRDYRAAHEKLASGTKVNG